MYALMLAGGLTGTYLTNMIFRLKKEGAGVKTEDAVSIIITPALQLNKKQNRVVPGLNLTAEF